MSARIRHASGALLAAVAIALLAATAPALGQESAASAPATAQPVQAEPPVASPAADSPLLLGALGVGGLALVLAAASLALLLSTRRAVEALKDALKTTTQGSNDSADRRPSKDVVLQVKATSSLVTELNARFLELERKLRGLTEGTGDAMLIDGPIETPRLRGTPGTSDPYLKGGQTSASSVASAASRTTSKAPPAPAPEPTFAGGEGFLKLGATDEEAPRRGGQNQPKEGLAAAAAAHEMSASRPAAVPQQPMATSTPSRQAASPMPVSARSDAGPVELLRAIQEVASDVIAEQSVVDARSMSNAVLSLLPPALQAQYKGFKFLVRAHASSSDMAMDFDRSDFLSATAQHSGQGWLVPNPRVSHAHSYYQYYEGDAGKWPNFAEPATCSVDNGGRATIIKKGRL